MERSDIFRKILDTEQEAKRRRELAVAQQEGLDKFLAEKEAEQRRESYARADSEIAAEENAFRASVDAELQRLRKKHERDLLSIHTGFDRKLDEWVTTLFDIVVRND